LGTKSRIRMGPLYEIKQFVEYSSGGSVAVVDSSRPPVRFSFANVSGRNRDSQPNQKQAKTQKQEKQRREANKKPFCSFFYLKPTERTKRAQKNGYSQSLAAANHITSTVSFYLLFDDECERPFVDQSYQSFGDLLLHITALLTNSPTLADRPEAGTVDSPEEEGGFNASGFG